jgi:aspartyl-tRNA(Asn)/glutamyl-tRNA(Gln) amidotransferase subunit C
MIMDDIKKYEAMVKLELTEDERGKISVMADELIAGFEILAGIDTDAEPMYTVLDVRNVLREDVTIKTVSKDEIMSNAPMQHNGYFQAPRAL